MNQKPDPTCNHCHFHKLWQSNCPTVQWLSQREGDPIPETGVDRARFHCGLRMKRTDFCVDMGSVQRLPLSTVTSCAQFAVGVWPRTAILIFHPCQWVAAPAARIDSPPSPCQKHFQPVWGSSDRKPGSDMIAGFKMDVFWCRKCKSMRNNTMILVTECKQLWLSCQELQSPTELWKKIKRFNLRAPPVYDRKVTNPFFSIIIVSIIIFFP